MCLLCFNCAALSSHFYFRSIQHIDTPQCFLTSLSFVLNIILLIIIFIIIVIIIIIIN